MSSPIPEIDIPSETFDVSDGATVQLPAGNLILSQPIHYHQKTGITVRGAGLTATQLRYRGATGTSAFFLRAAYDCRFEDMTLMADVPGTNGITVSPHAHPAGKPPTSRFTAERVRFVAGNTRWHNCISWDSTLPGSSDNNNDFHDIDNCLFYGYHNAGLYVRASQAKEWRVTRCEFYGESQARIGMYLHAAGSGRIQDCSFLNHAHNGAAIYGESLWSGDGLIIDGCSHESANGDRFLNTSLSGYPFPISIRGLRWRGKLPPAGAVVEHAKAGQLDMSASIISCVSGYEGLPLVACRSLPDSGVGTVRVASTEFNSHHPQDRPTSVLSCPADWERDFTCNVARSVNGPDPTTVKLTG